MTFFSKMVDFRAISVCSKIVQNVFNNFCNNKFLPKTNRFHENRQILTQLCPAAISVLDGHFEKTGGV
jgi:hypothetical protein